MPNGEGYTEEELLERRIKKVIISKLASVIEVYKTEEKSRAELITFLTGLTKTKIKAAVVAHLNAEKSAVQAKGLANMASIDELITEINSL